MDPTFALSLSRQVATSKDGSGKNLAFSPISVHVVLGLLAAGSRGAALDQILSLVRSPTADDLSSLASRIVGGILADGSDIGGPRLVSANSVWVGDDQTLKPSFMEIAASAYKADTKTVDFRNKFEAVRCEINSWAATVTEHLIKDLLPPFSVHKYTSLALVNALYFQGAWQNKFHESKTKDSEFNLLDGKSVDSVPFMTTYRDQFISAYDGFKVLRLPYEQGRVLVRRFSMYVFLPDVRDGLWGLWERLSSEPWFLERHIPKVKVVVGRFKLPRFKISFKLDAVQALKDLGLVLPFDEGLTEIVGLPVRVTNIFHESVVEVNEKGTEAAAATAALGMCFSCGPPRHPPRIVDFEADHPFVYLIREDISGAVLFVGHLLNPKQT